MIYDVADLSSDAECDSFSIVSIKPGSRVPENNLVNRNLNVPRNYHQLKTTFCVRDFRSLETCFFVTSKRIAPRPRWPVRRKLAVLGAVSKMFANRVCGADKTPLKRCLLRALSKWFVLYFAPPHRCTMYHECCSEFGAAS